MKFKCELYKIGCSVCYKCYSPWLQRSEGNQICPSVGAQSLGSGQIFIRACTTNLAIWMVGVAAHVVQRDETLRLAVDACSLQREARTVVAGEEGSVKFDTDDLARPAELDDAPVLTRVRASEVEVRWQWSEVIVMVVEPVGGERWGGGRQVLGVERVCGRCLRPTLQSPTHIRFRRVSHPSIHFPWTV